MKRILVVYHSQERGLTRRTAELVAQGCNQIDGVKAKLINVNDVRVSMEEAVSASAFAIGSPEYFGYVAGGIKQFFDDMKIAIQGGLAIGNKPYVAFISHENGGGKAAESLHSLASAVGLKKVANHLSFKGAPDTPEQAELAVQLGIIIAKTVTS